MYNADLYDPRAHVYRRNHIQDVPTTTAGDMYGVVYHLVNINPLANKTWDNSTGLPVRNSLRRNITVVYVLRRRYIVCICRVYVHWGVYIDFYICMYSRNLWYVDYKCTYIESDYVRFEVNHACNFVRLHDFNVI